MKDEDLYAFVYRGILTDKALETACRKTAGSFSNLEERRLEETLGYTALDPELMSNAKRMAKVYAALHAFENSVRAMVVKAMAEAYPLDWWTKVPERVQKTAKTRMEEEAKFKWHGARGAREIEYCDFGDLTSIIINNYVLFEDLLGGIEWVKNVLMILEKCRNVVMHGGSLSTEDVERVGLLMRDWVRVTG